MLWPPLRVRFLYGMLYFNTVRAFGRWDRSVRQRPCTVNPRGFIRWNIPLDITVFLD